MIVEYKTDGVRFTVPENVYVLKLRIKNPKTTQVGFQKAKRPVIYFKTIKIKEDGKAEPVTHFNSPLEIEVHYKKADEDNAGGAAAKQLAFFDEDIKLWKLITKNNHGFDPQDYAPNDPQALPGFKGYGVATFRNLPDPVIGWGP